MSNNMMEGERKRSKGGLFNLFDWNGKSRKKLFANNSELPEGLKQGKENVEKMEKLLLQAGELDDRRANLSNRGSSDFSCASSMTSDEGYGTRAPGAVARLMGLDSLPTSNVAEPSSTLVFDSRSLRAFQYDSSSPNLWSEYNPVDHLNVPNKQEKYAWNSVESRPHKVENRPSKRFQTETLPPKSAKSIPSTHHKLLSPIKNPGFTPTKNAAYIMEAAAKIIEANPKATSSGKVPSIGTSSVPLRIRDLKQKMEAAAHTTSKPQRSSESSVAKNTKGQQSDKSWSGPEGLSSSKASTSSEKGTPSSLKNKGKSVPLAAQAKSTNGQRRDGSTLKSKSIVKQKEKNEVKTNQMLKTQPCTQNTVQKRISESRTSNVLQQNNLKQNSAPNKDSSGLKNSLSNQQGRKTKSTSGSVGQSRTVKKVVVKPETVPRKMGLVMTDSEKEKTKNIARKKRSVSGDLQIDRNATPNVSFNKDEMSTKSNVVMDGNMNMAMDNRKSGMDVVSFTFSSPIKRATPSSQSSGQMSEKCSSSAIDSVGSKDHPSLKSSMSYFPGLNVMGGDVLGVLLEQKLRELTYKVESSHCNVIREETSSTSLSIFQNSETPNVASTSSAALDKMLQVVHDKDKSDSLGYFDCILVENSQLAMNQKWQQSEDMEVQSSSSNYSETGKEPSLSQINPTNHTLSHPKRNNNNNKKIKITGIYLTQTKQKARVPISLSSNIPKLLLLSSYQPSNLITSLHNIYTHTASYLGSYPYRTKEKKQVGRYIKFTSIDRENFQGIILFNMRKPTSSTATAEAAAAGGGPAAKSTPCCIKVGLKRGPWTPEEDELLANYIKKEGEGRWRTLPKKAGLLRCGKSCRLRWMNYLRPSVKRGQISPDEEDLILRLHRLLGNRWSLIAGRIPGRTDNEIKNYWNTHLSKKLISQGIDPRTHKPLINPQSFDQSKPSLSKANHLQESLKEPIKIASSGLEETTSGSAHIISNKENGDFQNNSNAHLGDQYHTGHFIASRGYTSLLNYDGSFGTDLRGNQRLGNGEAEDINSGTEDVFSFLNSLINEEAFQQHQIFNEPNVNSAPASTDPLFPIAGAATSFGLSTGWESTLMPSALDQNDSK